MSTANFTPIPTPTPTSIPRQTAVKSAATKGRTHLHRRLRGRRVYFPIHPIGLKGLRFSDYISAIDTHGRSRGGGLLRLD